MIWTEENIATLKSMWEAGDGGTAISDHFTRQGYSCSRNACIGLAHRRRFKTPNTDRVLRTAKAAYTRRHRADSHRTESVRKARIAAIKRSAGVSDASSRKPSRPPVVIPSTAPEPMHLKLMELRPRSCRFPYGGEVKGFSATFCGHRSVEGRPYCPFHGRLTSVPAPRA